MSNSLFPRLIWRSAAIAAAAWTLLPLAAVHAADPPGDPSNGGSRGEFCLIAPQSPGDAALVWSDRPLFAWTGNIKTIEVYTDDANQTLMWRYEVEASALDEASGVYQVTYDGEPLQPGEYYTWTLISTDDVPILRTDFQIMSTADRPEVDADLFASNSQSASATVTADYFVSQDMWSDALREVATAEDAAIQSDIQSDYLTAAHERWCTP